MALTPSGGASLRRRPVRRVRGGRHRVTGKWKKCSCDRSDGSDLTSMGAPTAACSACSRPGCWWAWPRPPSPTRRTVRWRSPGGRAARRSAPAPRRGCGSSTGRWCSRTASKRRAYHGTTYDVGSWTSSAGRARLRLHPAGRVVVGRDAQEQLGRDPGAGGHRVRPVEVDGAGAVGVLGQARAAYLRARPVRRARPRRRRHVEGGVVRRLLPAPGAADAPGRCVVGLALGVLRGRRRVPAAVVGPRRLRARRRVRHRARRPALLADGAPRRVLAVRRRRRGVVLPDVDRDGAGLLRPAACSRLLLAGSAPAPTPGSTRSRAAPTTSPTKAPATGRSTRRTPPRAGSSAFVTRLRSLSEAESLIAAGIPVIASVSFSSGGLYGAPISSTAGHLLVIVGFTRHGRRGRQRPGRARRPRACGAPTTGRSSSRSGWAAPAARRTSSTTPRTRCPPRPGTGSRASERDRGAVPVRRQPG